MERNRSHFPLTEREIIAFKASLPNYYNGQDLSIVDLFCGTPNMDQAVYKRYRDYLGSRFEYLGIDMLLKDEERLDPNRNLVTTVRQNLLLDMFIPAEDKTVDILHMHMPLLFPINETLDPYSGVKFSYDDLGSEVKRVLRGKFLMSIDTAFLKSIFQPKTMYDNVDELLGNIDLKLISAYYASEGHIDLHLKKWHRIRSDGPFGYRPFSKEYALPNLFLMYQVE